VKKSMTIFLFLKLCLKIKSKVKFRLENPFRRKIKLRLKKHKKASASKNLFTVAAKRKGRKKDFLSEKHKINEKEKISFDT
jgi:hypothetical protein